MFYDARRTLSSSAHTSPRHFNFPSSFSWVCKLVEKQHLKQFSTDRQRLFAFNTNCVYWKTECLWPVNMLFCLLKLLTFSASFYPPTTEENWTNSHGVEENGKLLSMWVAIGADLNLIEKFLSPSWMRLQRPLALSDASSELCDNDSSPLEQIINT